MTVLKQILVYADAAPTKIAIDEDGRTLTYGELNRQTDALARYLLDAVPDRSQVIGCVKCSMTTTLLVGIAALKSGHAFTILDARDSLARLRQVFNTAECRLLLVDDASQIENLRPLGFQIHVLSELQLEASSEPIEPPDPNTTSYIEPTSGSTGTPKLVPISQATLFHYTALQRDLGDIQSDDVVALLGEMWFDTLLSGLLAGATLVAYDLRRHGPATICDWLADKKVSVIQTFVAAFRSIADASNEPLNDLRIVKIAGEVVLKSDVDAFESLCTPNAQLINYYGSTECSLVSAYIHTHGAATPDGAGLPVGKAVPGTTVDLLGEDDTPTPDGAVGKVIVRASHMATGYFNAPDRTKGVYWQENDGTCVLNTGDLAKRSPDGDLIIVGRLDDQVKIRGYSVRISEVEELISRLPEIDTVAVTAVSTPTGIRQLVCHYTIHAGRSPSVSELRAALKENAPAYMIPSYFMQRDDFPRTDTGKILRRALPNPLDQAPADAKTLALTETEAVVAEVWRDVLGHSNFSRTDDFFDIGGESLQAMAVVIRLERRLPVRIGYESLVMQGATIETIAARIDDAIVLDRAPRTLLMKKGGDRRPVYLLPVENGEFSDWLYMLNESDDVRDFVGVHSRDISARSHFPRASIQELGAYAAEGLIKADPEGPYVLAGYSAGTQLAIETARALQSKRKEVAGLILLDPVITEQEAEYRSWKWRRILSPALKRGALGTSLNRAGHILFGAAAHELDVADETLYWTYRPQQLHGIPTVLGRAMDGKDNPEAYANYWQDVLGADIDVWDLPGYHNRITRDPFAGPLAARVEAWVREKLGEQDKRKKAGDAGHFPVAEPAMAS